MDIMNRPTEVFLQACSALEMLYAYTSLACTVTFLGRVNTFLALSVLITTIKWYQTVS